MSCNSPLKGPIKYQRGDTFRIPLGFVATDGELITDVTLIEADLRYAGTMQPREVLPSFSLIGSFTFLPQSGGAGWIAVYEDTAELALGYYVADARAVVTDIGVIITDPLVIKLEEPVTRRPA